MAIRLEPISDILLAKLLYERKNNILVIGTSVHSRKLWKLKSNKLLFD